MSKFQFGKPGEPGRGLPNSPGDLATGEQAHVAGQHGSALELMFDKGVMFELASIIVSGIARLPTSSPSLPGHFKSIPPQGEILLLLPANVLNAFALETYLKCLTRLENHEPARTHDLRELFGALEPSTQAAVRDRYVALVQKHHPRGLTELGIPVDLDFDPVLLKSAKAFAEWRYAYENAVKGESAYLLYRAELIAIAAREVTIQRQAGWAHHADRIDRCSP